MVLTTKPVVFTRVIRTILCSLGLDRCLLTCVHHCNVSFYTDLLGVPPTDSFLPAESENHDLQSVCSLVLESCAVSGSCSYAYNLGYDTVAIWESP